MTPLPGYRLASWATGYQDFHAVPDWTLDGARLRYRTVPSSRKENGASDFRQDTEHNTHGCPQMNEPARPVSTELAAEIWERRPRLRI